MPTSTNTNTNKTLNSQLASLQRSEGETIYPYVIFQVFENKFAVNSKYVLSIEKAENVSGPTGLVRSSGGVRGISYYKNEAIHIFDLRKLFGYMSQTDYINNVVNIPQRIKEHESYAQTLKNCILSGDLFSLNIDPHKCAFGKWFYNQKIKINLETRKSMEKLEPFHDNFHKLAAEIKIMLENGKKELAAEYLNKIDVLKDDIIQKLHDFEDVLTGSAQELDIILQVKGKKIGLVVDNAESVEDIDEVQNLPPAVVMTKYIKKLGLNKKDRKIIFILEADEFV